MLATSTVYASRHPAAWLVTATEEEPSLFFVGTFDVTVEYDPEFYDIFSWNAHMLLIPTQVEGEFVEFDTAVLEQTPEYRAVRATYRYEDGWLVVDRVALYAYLQPYVQNGFPVTKVIYSRPGPQYISTARQGLLRDASGWISQKSRAYALCLSELEQAGESDRYARFDTTRATWEELVYRFIAHWL